MQDSVKETPLVRYYSARYRRFRLLLEWRKFVSILHEAVKAFAPDAQVFTFGSALRGELTANSDVDVLIVTKKAKGRERHRLAAAIEAKLDEKLASSIFELHVVQPQRLPWYKRHAKELTPLQKLQ